MLDVDSGPSWDANGPWAVLELAPAVDVDRASVQLDLAVQPGVVPGFRLDRPREAHGSFRTPAARLVRLESGMVDTDLGVALSRRAGFVGDSLRRNPQQMERLGYVFHENGEMSLPEREIVEVDFSAIQIGLPFGHHYFHWLVEGLGQLLISREFLPPDVHVAVESGLKRFHTQTLAAAGIPPDAVFELPPNRIVQFAQLYVPPKTMTRNSTLQPLAVNAVRRLARPTHGEPLRLYVAREPDARRRIVNDADVSATLERHGFSEVTPGDLSFQDQVDLFGRAEAIVGAHGSGLTNMIFSPPETLLVELHSPKLNRHWGVFWNLAAIIGLRYIRVLCQPLTSERHSNFEVDCAHLDALLHKWLPDGPG